MGGMKNLQFAEASRDTLDEYAARLNGEVEGEFIICPSPGRPHDDRTCKVRINPDHPSYLFIYACDGPEGAAYSFVRSAIGEIAPRCDYENGERARRIWAETLPAAGTHVERYLRKRGITGSAPPALRFHPRLKHTPSGGMWPAMVSGVSSPNGTISAVHRTWLTWSGDSKAPIEPQKMTLGSTRGCAIRLCPVSPKLIIAEGIETALSVMQATGIGAWAALSAIGLRTIVLPREVTHIIFAADGDAVGLRMAKAAARRLRAEGRIATIASAPTGKDFNDLLMEEIHHG